MTALFVRGFGAVLRRSRLGSCVPLGLVLAVGCHKTPEPPNSRQASSRASVGVRARPAHPSPAASTTPPVEITWLDPAGLRRVPPKNGMRKASYEVPHAPGDTENGDLAVFYFGPGEGGGIEQNMARWVKQFPDVRSGDVKRSDREANGLRQHMVEIPNGTYDPGMPGMGPAGPKKNYALEGAIVEAPSGAYFFKMTGPAKTIAAARAAFIQLLDSVRAA